MNEFENKKRECMKEAIHWVRVDIENAINERRIVLKCIPTLIRQRLFGMCCGLPNRIDYDIWECPSCGSTDMLFEMAVRHVGTQHGFYQAPWDRPTGAWILVSYRYWHCKHCGYKGADKSLPRW